MTTRVAGLNATLLGLGRAKDRVLAAASGALYNEGQTIMGASQQEVPVDTGTLRSSGQVQPPAKRTGEVSVELGYGYGDAMNPSTGEPVTGYAIYVHERLDTKHAAPTKAKFLEDPAKAAEAGFAARVRAVIDAALGG